MNKTWLCLVGLILVFSSFQIALSSSDPASYDVMADVNRDRIVDVNDLSRLGRAYGSNMVLPYEPGKVIVIVRSYDREPPEVENARVAIIDPTLLDQPWQSTINVTYTNSSGIATFDLSPNKNYTTLVWGGSSYNYANLTTNGLGEASVMISLGEPSLPQIRSLPKGWVVVTVLRNGTGSLYSEVFGVIFYDLKWIGLWESLGIWRGDEIRSFSSGSCSLFVLPLGSMTNKSFSRIGIGCFDPGGYTLGDSVFSPDEDGCANVVVYVTSP